MRGSSLLPFEFQALEACLEAICQCLESEVIFFLLLPCQVHVFIFL